MFCLLLITIVSFSQRFEHSKARNHRDRVVFEDRSKASYLGSIKAQYQKTFCLEHCFEISMAHEDPILEYLYLMKLLNISQLVFHHMQDGFSDLSSVTRFGEILPLWQNFLLPQILFECLFCIGQNVDPNWANILLYWTKQT